MLFSDRAESRATGFEGSAAERTRFAHSELESCLQDAGSTPSIAIPRRGIILLAGMVGASALASCSDSHAPGPAQRKPAVKAQGQVHLNFENGELGPPISHHVGARVGTDFARRGRYGCRLEPRKSDGGLASLVVSNGGFKAGRPWAALSISFRLVTSPKVTDQYMNLFEIGTTATKRPKSQFTVFFKSDKIFCDFNSSESTEITDLPAIGTWHTMRVVAGFGGKTYRARVKFDDGAVTELVSKDDKTPESVKALWIHYPTVPVDYTMDIDDLIMGTYKKEPGLPA